MRKLATIATITDVTPIEGADAIEVAHIRGWQVVVAKNENHHVGEQVLYIEADAALPLNDTRFAFLAPRGKKIFGGEDVHVLRTIKLRGVYSQGLILPLSEFPELILHGKDCIYGMEDCYCQENAKKSIDEVLGIEVYEPPLPMGALDMAGVFPHYIQKTDAERVQNLDEETWQKIQETSENWIATEKIDGSSVTAWVTDDLEGEDRDTYVGQLRVASRNWELKDTNNAYWRVVRELPLDANEWVQGEVAGPGIQGNPLNLKQERIFIFGYGTFTGNGDGSYGGFERTPREEWPAWAQELAAPTYDFKLPETIEETIAQVETLKSLVTPDRGSEGVVWTHKDGTPLPGLDNRPIFKSISAAYLAKQAKKEK